MKVTIKGKEIELELTDEQKAEVERALKPNTGWERVALSDTYFTVDNKGFLRNIKEDRDEYDNQAYDNANYFTRTELTMNIARAQTLQRKLWRRSAELCKKIDWNNKDKTKYSIVYNNKRNELSIAYFDSYTDFGQVYFDTEEHARQALEEFRDELTWYFTEFKSRMD